MGVVQSGWRLVGKREQQGGFGMANCEANRDLLGYEWDAQACDPAEWQPYDVPMVFGNPPCSAFSLLTSKKARGEDSPINNCMHALMHFAARCDPEIVIMESVQGALTQGRPLMQRLRASLEAQTGRRYGMWNVLHNAVMVGGAAERRRYFLVLSTMPFGVEAVPLSKLPTLGDAIGDLLPLGLTWDEQPYRAPETWWSRDKRRTDGLVDGQACDKDTLSQRMTHSLLKSDVPWYQGENTTAALRRYYQTKGEVPEPWAHKIEKLLRDDFEMGFSQPNRWRWDRPAHVITGGGLGQLHPLAPRQFTHREVARIMGFPDAWKLNPLRNVRGLPQTHGKGVTVQCGKWIGEWALNSLNGEPGSDIGEEVGDRERTINHTNIWKHLRPKRVKDAVPV